jgi:hypothetical protein
MPDDAAELGFKGGELSSAAQPSRGDYIGWAVTIIHIAVEDRGFERSPTQLRLRGAENAATCVLPGWTEP